MNREEKALLEKAGNGDMDAFAELFEPLRSMAYAVACRIVGANDAEDVVMKAYLKAWQSLPRFRGGSSTKTWLYRITYNVTCDWLRRRRIEGDGEFDDRIGPGAVAAGASTVPASAGRPDERPCSAALPAISGGVRRGPR